MFQSSILIIGASTALLSLAKSYVYLVLYAITFGFFDGCFVGQVAVVTSSIVGMKHLGVALGYLFGSIAIPMTLGPPVAGKLLYLFSSHVHCKICELNLALRTAL
jgi:MCP family monocarboxylic acid transporter-like MFS transporter 10